MIEPHSSKSVQVQRLLGDPHPLAERLGGTESLATLTLGTAPPIEQVLDESSLRRFLSHYQARVLAPVELPAIVRAYGYASRSQFRELLALDHALRGETRLHEFAVASQAVGRSQLHRLLPMYDLRLVRRYWQAAEAGEAHAWHVLVYGLVLAVFSLPLRQGLLNYAQQTMQGFIGSAAARLELSPAQGDAVFADCAADLPAHVEAVLQPIAEPRLLVV